MSQPRKQKKKSRKIVSKVQSAELRNYGLRDPTLVPWVPYLKVDRIVPRTMHVHLKYTKSFLLTSIAASTVGARFYSNVTYDVDPTLGSTAISGLAEWNAFYNYNRVLGYKDTITFANNEVVPVFVVITHENTDPGTSGANARAFSERNNAQSRLLAPYTGIDKAVIRCKHLSIPQIVGSTSPLVEDNYRGTSSSNPTDLTYVGINMDISPANFSASGVSILYEHEIVVEFSDRKIVTS